MNRVLTQVQINILVVHLEEYSELAAVCEGSIIGRMLNTATILKHQNKDVSLKNRIQKIYDVWDKRFKQLNLH